jgi:hypothetical protein
MPVASESDWARLLRTIDNTPSRRVPVDRIRGSRSPDDAIPAVVNGTTTVITVDDDRVREYRLPPPPRVPVDRIIRGSIDWNDPIQYANQAIDWHDAIQARGGYIPPTPPEPYVPPAWTWEITGVSPTTDTIVASAPGSRVTGRIQIASVGNPNHQNEGESSMPAEQITVQLPTNVRRRVFDGLGGADSLMSNLDLSNWEQVLHSLEGQLGPVQVGVSRGSFTLDSRLRSVHPLLGMVDIEFLGLEEARSIIDIASNGKMTLEVFPSTEATPTAYEIRPMNDIDAEGFRAYGGTARFNTVESGASVGVSDLRSGMSQYLDYRHRRGTYIRQAIQRRMTSGNAVTTKDPALSAETKKKRDTSLYNFLDNVKKSTKSEKSPFQKIAILPHKTLSSTRWGIEIEAVDIYGIETPQHWALHGDGSLRTMSNFQDEGSIEHDDDCALYWDEDAEESDEFTAGVCNCDSVRSQSNAEGAVGRREQAGEWNSPILHSFHSRGLQHICDELKGRYSNSSAGVHVHVEAGKLLPDQAVALTMIYSALEPLFEQEYRRTERNYCKAVDLTELISRLDTAKTLKGKPATDFRTSRRYFTVNLASLNSHGTIEFRAMGPVYEYEHLIRWAAFCREMVNIAKANVPQRAWARVKTFDDLIVLFSKYGKETPTPKWAEDGKIDFDPIVAALGTENRRLPNARPSHAYTSGGSGVAPVELFDDYSSEVVMTTGQPSQTVLAREGW